ncbi:DeoR/GlpR family DNA-binding transcription regulator [Falsibacillus albus]|uniref:DeoR/GlpR transcriptional regulator n=1 Tax=Falsibacillus albus TaxID=2478915 RepID=A0A3L7JZP0_9BACI|nr:DeoR/GlpR family DNA-binding transcription regulator [Falsibacillus albus]RLQ96247.1 DeoR/GlpR transcriptional regulator [Falsibacillus albus]
MFSEERREQILNLLEQSGRVMVKDLAETFQVSIDSIRRDLSILEEKGLLKRTHGGAISNTGVRQAPRPPSERFSEGTIHQNAIAKLAASYIDEHSTIFIGGASIHYVLLKYIPINIEYTVVTNSLEVAYVLREYENIQLFLIAGNVKASGNITDALATEFSRQFTFDLCFATAGALSSNGLSTATPEVAIFHKTIYSRSRTVIALIEHHKFGKDMFSGMFPLNQLDLVITDEETLEKYLKMLGLNGVDVIVAK